MVRLRLAFIAETVIRDAATNVISAFNIVDELSSHGYPLLVPKLAAVVVLARDAGDADEHALLLRVTIDGKQINEFSLAMKFQGVMVTRGIMMFQALRDFVWVN